MEKMKIGIDLDKTLFDYRGILYNFLNTLNLNRNKTLKHHEIDKRDYKGCKVCKLFRLLNPDFYFTYPNAVETINKLSELGFEVHIVSNRPKINAIVALTIASLEKHNVKYDKLILGCNNKQGYAKMAKLDYFIDNVDEICFDFAKNTNTKAIHFNPIIKKHKRQVLSGVNKCSTWNAIGEFFAVENKKIEDRKTMMDFLNKQFPNNFLSKGLCLPSPRK